MWAPQIAVIPAKAGIHLADHRECPLHGLDSRLRGNDQGFEKDHLPVVDGLDSRLCEIDQWFEGSSEMTPTPAPVRLAVDNLTLVKSVAFWIDTLL